MQLPQSVFFVEKVCVSMQCLDTLCTPTVYGLDFDIDGP